MRHRLCLIPGLFSSETRDASAESDPMSDQTPDPASGQNPNQDRNSGKKKQKKNKPTKVRPRLPRGLQDRDAADLRAQSAMIDTVRGVFERYGFDPVETPMIEYTDALGKFLPDSRTGPMRGCSRSRMMTSSGCRLRYDLTAPLARYVAENRERSDAALSQLSGRARLPQREARPGPLPAVHAVRCWTPWARPARRRMRKSA
jgi:hypothetical protein